MIRARWRVDTDAIATPMAKSRLDSAPALESAFLVQMVAFHEFYVHSMSSSVIDVPNETSLLEIRRTVFRRFDPKKTLSLPRCVLE